MISKNDARNGTQKKDKFTPNPRRRKGDRSAPATAKGMTVPRFFTREGVHPFDEVEWELRTAAITGEGGQVYFEQKDVEVPATWSQLATNVVVQKYFRGAIGTAARERSVRQLIARVVDTITGWGTKQHYFATDKDAATFAAELSHLLVEQKMSFNSPVWFNVGVEAQPQCSACFINSVDDSMDSILSLARTEGMLFKYGSGTGTNLSPIRSSKELLNGGGTASGPVSFMKGFDAFAGVIKSGGKTRRAAKMVILNVDHPDVVDFIGCKSSEERKAWALIDAGYDGSFTGEAYGSVFFQNSNNSVRVTDEFMDAVSKDRVWHTRAVLTGAIVESHRARDLWHKIAEAAWQCGDPGLQFDTTINDWHTSKNTARINASNPCSEYMYLDDSACNLASLNLRKFHQPAASGSEVGEFDVAAFKRAVEITILAQEIIVDNAKYPSEKIAANSFAFRPLGLGYANLGSLLMARGLPYDSDAGRAFAGAVTALMCGHAYATSAKIARDVTGPFAGYAVNQAPFVGVMEKHRQKVDKIDKALAPYDLLAAAREAWDETLAVGKQYGFRNGQVTVLAPTGTIGFMMDCDTTGIEPDIALVKYKRLVGGGTLKIVNHTVPEALTRLGYAEDERKQILDHINDQETIEGAPGLKAEHLPVFDCAFRAQNGTRSIHHMGHLKMMAAAQPFLSGAISKTVNLPSDCTVSDIEDSYMEAWKLGLKAVAVYRDGCKRSQPLSTSKKVNADGTLGGGSGGGAALGLGSDGGTVPNPQDLARVMGLTPEELVLKVAAQVNPQGAPVAVRRRLPDERRSLTHKFSIAGHDGYIHVGVYADGTPGEIFVRMAKEGSTISGLMDSFATAVSLALQHGVPLKLLVDKFSHTRFEPSGWTGNPDISRASSIMDYLFRWLGTKFLPTRPPEQLELPKVEEAPAPTADLTGARPPVPQSQTQAPAPVRAAGGSWLQETDAPACHECGTIMVRSGACYKCGNCGSTSGCS